jgi:hypothetical protein
MVDQPTQKTLEMRVAELEDKLAKLNVSEDEMRAYQKVSAALGAGGAQAAQPCVIQQSCHVLPCIIRQCWPCWRSPCVPCVCPANCGPCACTPCAAGGAGFGSLGS